MTEASDHPTDGAAARQGGPSEAGPSDLQADAASRSRIREAVIESESLWLSAFDPQGRIVLWNRAAERISGYSRGEVLGHERVWEWLFPDAHHQEPVWQRLLARAKALKDAEIPIRCKDGGSRVLTLAVGTLGGGAAEGYLVWGRDVTDLLSAANGRKRREGVFERLLSSLKVGVFKALRQSPGRGFIANPALARMLGYDSTSALLHADYEQALPPGERERFAAQLRQYGEVRDFELELRRKDGSPVVVAVGAQAEYDEQGQLVTITGTVEDITERKAAEQALRASEEKYRMLVEGAGEPILTINRDGVCLAMNRVAAQYLDGEPEDYEGKTLGSLIPAETADAFMASLHEVIQSGKPVSKELRVVFEGQEWWFRSRVHPLRDPDGSISKVQVVALDITDRKLAEQELLHYQERLRALAARLSVAEERERRRIAMDLHDDISQSLALAIMKLGLLKGALNRRKEAQTLKEVQELAEQALQSARTLTTELSPPVLTEFGFVEALEWLAERTRERYGIAVSVEHSGPAQPLDEQTQIVLYKAVRELLVNVARHAHASRATVSTRAEGDEVTVTVADDGRGFSDASALRSGMAEGGFGLFNIREQLKQLGGSVEVQSRPGRGTRVRLAVPARMDEPDPQGGRP